MTAAMRASSDAVATREVLHDAHVQAWLSRPVVAPFSYSLGRSRADAHPSVHNARTFDELQDAVLSARHDRPKELAPYFARPFRTNGAELPQRGVEYALPCAWIALDVDTLAPDAEPKLNTALAPWRGFWHASLSATPENLKRRVVLECNRVVEVAEHRRLVAAVERRLREQVGDGIAFDGAASGDVARLWYLPAEGAAAGAFVGEPIDVDRALAFAEKGHAETEPGHATHDGATFAEGGRNTMLTREAGKLRRIGLSTEAIAAALHVINRERCDPPLPDGEAETIARSIGKKPAGATDDSNDELPPITVDSARLPADWVEAEQQPPPFVVAGLLPQSEAGSLVSPGAFGKSTLKLLESVHVILGRDLYGRSIRKPGAVLCVSKEDRAELIEYRLKKICQGLNLSDSDMHRVHEHFLRLDLRGDEFMLQRLGTERIPFRSGDVGELLKTFAGEGIASAWFDTASRFVTGEGNQESAITLDACTVLADGWRAAVEVLHHVSQGIARTGTVDMHAARGATAFVDNSRFARQLVRHTNGEALPGAITYQPPASVDPQAETLIRMHVVKLTGARFDMHAPIWIERRDEWRFVCTEGATGNRQSREDTRIEARAEQEAEDDGAVLAFVRDRLAQDPPQRMSQNDVCEARGRIVRGMSQHRARAAVARLRLDGSLVEAPMPGKARGARHFLAPAGWQEPLA